MHIKHLTFWGWTLLAATVTAVACTVITPSIAIGETRVTTYVTHVQEEREQTRWTLTEWLRIKERMRMMDLWLAMFSDPKKTQFRPELMLSYQMTRSKYTLSAAGAMTGEGSLTGSSGKAQLWLTNLISSTVGIRTLNVDLGMEGLRRMTSGISAATGALSATRSLSATSSSTATTTAGGGAAAPSLQNQYYAGALRVFGRNIQDTSLVFKYGQYTARDQLLDTATATSPAPISGAMAGVELQLYLLRSLGVEGNVTQWGDGAGVEGSALQRGLSYDYGAFIEVSMLRLMVGIYSEARSQARGGQSFETRETGSQAGLKLQF